jgi:membrane protease subunit HflC
MGRLGILAALGALLLGTALSSVFIVDEREKALVLQFGQIVKVKETPGLGFKVPFLQEVVNYDDRILSREIDPFEVTPSDDRRLIVDAFARYRIVDVIRFRQATGAGGERFAEDRIEGILTNKMRDALGEVTSAEILSANRAALTQRIREAARAEASALGVEIVDVRIKRSDLPEQNLDATFARMRAEREREAADERARGQEAAQRVRAQADRTVVELVSDARRQSEITRGEADAERNAIFAGAFGKDPEFFEFYRSLAAYRSSMLAGNSTMVMAPDSDFFNYLKSADPPAPAAAATE